MDTKQTNVTEEELHPTYQMIAKIVGLDITIKLGQEMGGAYLYLPQTLKSLTASRREERNKKIVEDHKTGLCTQEQLARKYKMTPQGIHDVLRRAKASGAPSTTDALRGDALIDRVRQILGDLDEEARREVLKYVIKRKNSSQAKATD